MNEPRNNPGSAQGNQSTRGTIVNAWGLQVEGELLEPDPIRSASTMSIVDRVPVHELIARDQETALSLVRLFRHWPLDPYPVAEYRSQLPFEAYHIEPSRIESHRISSGAASATSSLDSGDQPRKRKRHRALKSGQWFQRYQELIQYKKEHGSTHVPHNWDPNVGLAQWVKRQRYQYTLREEGKHSVLTDERKAALDEIGFVWSSHGAIWEERLDDLQAFAKRFGHCNVPKNYPDNKALAVWVKSQRRQYKLFQRGEQCTMTPERISKLNALGFEWDRGSSADAKPRARRKSGDSSGYSSDESTAIH